MTAENNHRHYEEMFHAYELGMLDDEERQELEEHLTECDQCFGKIKQTQAASLLLKHDKDVRKTVGDIESNFDRGAARSKIRWSRLWPAYTVIIFLLVMLLKPWKIEFSPGQEAIAAQNRLAIIKFENLADPSDSLRWGQMMAHLLISDLAEQASVQIVSEQRLFDASSELDIGDSAQVSQKKALEIGKRTNAKLILIGQIMQDCGRIAINTQIVDVESGAVKAAQRVVSDSVMNLFTLVDRLTVQIREDLALRESPSGKSEIRVADITTHSLEAYRYFQIGVDYYQHGAWIRAEENFVKAVAIDSTMGMAYYYLSFLRGGWESEKTIDQALQFIDRVGWRERYLIRSWAAYVKGNYVEAIAEMMKLVEKVPDDKKAYYWLGLYNLNLPLKSEAIRYLSRSLEIDPKYTPALNALAYTYSKTGDFVNALKIADRYIALAPEVPGSYLAKGKILAEAGRFDEAIIYGNTALEKDPRSFEALHFLALIYMIQEKYDLVEEYFKRMAADSNILVRESGHLYLAYLPILQGDLIKALGLLESDSALHIEAVQKGAFPYNDLLRAMIYEELGETAKALDIMIGAEKIVEEFYPDNKIIWDYYIIQLMSELGRFEDAQKRLIRLQDILKVREQREQYQIHYGAGAIALARRDYRTAIDELDRATRISGSDAFFVCYMLGRAYFEAGKYIEAVEAFERRINSVDSYRFFHSVWLVKAYYYLGESYDRLNQKDRAMEYYGKFLYHWGNRNPHTPLIEQARRRLSALGGQIPVTP